MEKISGVVCTFNEEKNIAACLLSLSLAGCNETVVADDGSSDHTRDIAKKMGARVRIRKDWSVEATYENWLDFQVKFGWKPTFKAGDRIRNGHLESAEGISFAQNDWVLNPDADERVTILDYDQLQREMAQCDILNCLFVHEHRPDGSPVKVTRIIKMFKKSKVEIAARTHTCLIPHGKVMNTDSLRIDHYQNVGHTQSDVLPILEYSIIQEDDSRSRFYLGREYYFHGEFAKAEKLVDYYLAHADFPAEITVARLLRANILWRDGSGRGDEVRAECLRALTENPQQSETLRLLSEVYVEPWSHKWAQLAEHATDEDTLF
jgi:glycosyltransferase involved in cell wall biosynthesis